MEWLNFIATEVHKQFSPLWYPDTPDATKEAQRAKLAKRFDHLAATLGKQPYLMGDKFTVADAYLHAMLNWTGHLKVDLTPWPALQEYQQRDRRASRGDGSAEGRAHGADATGAKAA